MRKEKEWDHRSREASHSGFSHGPISVFVNGACSRLTRNARVKEKGTGGEKASTRSTTRRKIIPVHLDSRSSNGPPSTRQPVELFDAALLSSQFTFSFVFAAFREQRSSEAKRGGVSLIKTTATRISGFSRSKIVRAVNRDACNLRG